MMAPQKPAGKLAGSPLSVDLGKLAATNLLVLPELLERLVVAFEDIRDDLDTLTLAVKRMGMKEGVLTEKDFEQEEKGEHGTDTSDPA